MLCTLLAYAKYYIAGQSEVTPGTELLVIQKVPDNLMPTPQNKLVPIESAYSDDEGEMALVKENKQVSHMLCHIDQIHVVTCNTHTRLNLFHTHCQCILSPPLTGL